MRLLSLQALPGDAEHQAFTDLVHFAGELFCVLREGQSHISADGRIRVMHSSDGFRWQSTALLRCNWADLRDPRLLVRADGQLILHACAALHQPAACSHRNLAWISQDGRHWSEAKTIAEDNIWLWRSLWQGGKALGMGYRCGKPRFVRLYQSVDGLDWQIVSKQAYSGSYANESALMIDSEQRAWCLLRRDPDNALLGVADSPWQNWQWRDIGERIGSPQWLRLDDGRLLAAVRKYQPHERCCLAWVDTEQARLTECLALPSGGDCGYPGMVLWQDDLWVSYYSSHEGASRVYLAQINGAS